MDNSFTEGSFTFIIRGEDLKPEEITAKLNLLPSSIKLKGEPITETKNVKDSYWSYNVDYSGNENHNLALEQLLSTLEPSKTVINEIVEQYETYIYFSLRSNSGQLGFELEPKIIKALSELNIKMEVHILSYGEVD